MALDLSKVNEIDMECHVDDDDDGFGAFTSGPTTVFPKDYFNEYKDDENETDNREIKSKTGIIISFDDSENDINLKPITAQLENDKLIIDAPSLPIHNEPTGINEIDMECSVGEDDDDFVLGYSATVSKKEKLDFGDDENDFHLLDEDAVEASKKAAAKDLDQGKVEDDYYDELKKKHRATNKKGAYNTHFHFAGNPKLEMDDFNAEMTPQGPIPNMVTATAQASAEASVAESKNHPTYRQLFEDLLTITGFELRSSEDGKCQLADILAKDSVQTCDTINDVEMLLSPYVEDCFIIPLQVETGKDFKNCKDWVNWYTPEMQSKYPQCANDIKYCDVFGNHLVDCKLF